MLIEAQLDLLDHDDWDKLMEFEMDATDLKVLQEEEV